MKLKSNNNILKRDLSKRLEPVVLRADHTTDVVKLIQDRINEKMFLFGFIGSKTEEF
jgi:hypothetical protein